jgi:hypothetical protein
MVDKDHPMTHYYSPHTGEHINTNTPADWMSSTVLPVPSYDPSTSSAIFANGVWSVVQALPALTPPPRFTSLEFLDLFTEAEQLAIVQAGMQSAAVKLWYDRALAASFVTLADPRTEAGLTTLVSAGLLKAARKTAIVEAMQ